MWLTLAGVAAFIAAEICGICDLYAFERTGIERLVGIRGIALVAAINVALAVLMVRIGCALGNRQPSFPRVMNAILVIGAVLALWSVDWLFMTHPLSEQALLLIHPQRQLTLPDAAVRDFGAFSIVRDNNASATEALRVLYERTRINSPEVYEQHPLGATIDRYAARYQVDPAILFFLNYIDSWYDAATPGPVPFLRALSPENVRDFVQTHLPAWFVESPLRLALITSRLDPLVGKTLGFDLRYAFHKATLDASISPYGLNTYSDIYLVLREYPGEFPDVFKRSDPGPLVTALRDSFNALRGSALLPPYEEPYVHAAYDATYYRANRDNLKRFTRAAYYLTLLDFDFATRVQALLTQYERDYYIRHLGAEQWSSLPAWQQAALLVMIRDLYTGYVGRVGYNLYAIPEINCTPLAWVTSRALAEGGLPRDDRDPLWRPRNYDDLWGGAGYRVRVFSDVWKLVHGREFPGLVAEPTEDEARRIIRAVADR